MQEQPTHLRLNSSDRQLSAPKWTERKRRKERDRKTEGGKLECGRQRSGNETAEGGEKKIVVELNHVPGLVSGCRRRKRVM